MKQYTLEVVINEGRDEFWEAATAGDRTGCDEVIELLRNELYQVGFDTDNCKITMKQYIDKA